MQKVQDYNKVFRSMQLIALLSFSGFVAATVFYYFQYKSLVDRQSDKVYVVTDKGTYSAYFTEEREVTPFEARYMSEVFFKSMFAHDASSYDQHIDDALNLIDEPSGLMIVETFDKGDVKKNYVRWGSRTEVEIDSIKIINNGIPMEATAYFRQRHYIGSEVKSELAIACQYNIVKTHRHEKNPFGLLISELDFIPYHVENLK